MNSLVELQKYGQSFWYDNIRRSLFTTGELRRMIEQDGLRGMTSNPTIFEKAITGSADYDSALADLVARDLLIEEIYEELAVADIQAAADSFRPVYESEHGNDGYVSLEVSPRLAHDTEATIAEALRLWKKVGRPNVMIKVPSTPAGIPAIERLIGSGLNINVTLMFSMESYEKAAEAYIGGLEKLGRDGGDITRTASVASLFVSRVDTAVDKILEQNKAPGDLLGKAAIANSKALYQRFKEIFHGGRFAALRGRGARVQRLLWASTSTKNPKYRDVMYAEALIGPETVDTMPDQTIAAFRDHGVARATLEEGLEESRRLLERLKEAGVDMAAVMQKLQDEGVKLFADSFEKLMQALEEKRHKLLVSMGRHHPRIFDEAAFKRIERVVSGDTAQRLLDRDPTLWKDDAATGEKIRNRLGWLTSPRDMRAEAPAIEEFAARVKQDGFTHVLLLGMGGSSLCPEVCRNTLGVAPGYPDLRVVDTTDPGAVLAIERSVDLTRTLFINASKSGTTVESASLARYFWNKVERKEQFVAITEAGTALDQEGQKRGYRAVFRNPADIGGRYSALSYFGLAPAALMGADIRGLLDRAEEAAREVRAYGPSDRPGPKDGIALGTMLAEAAALGRDKVTFILSPGVADFGNWVEQLIAESTGKEGKGLVPVVGEPVGPPGVYGDDRVFISMWVQGEDAGYLHPAMQALERAGHLCWKLPLRDKLDLGAEFYRWEVATAVCGSVIKINPFDEPNVTESKDNTMRLLKQYQADGRLPAIQPSHVDAVPRLLEQARPGDYVAILAFLNPTAETAARLREIRTRLRDATRLATTLGFGPRYLHSTGQLHKGGPDKGLFILLTADDPEDIPIPGQPYTFGTLKQAQALGDLESLKGRGRRVLHLHLGQDVGGGLEELQQALAASARAAD